MIHSHTIKWLGTEKFWTAARDRMRTLNSCTLYNIASRLLYLISMYVFMRGCLTCSPCCISGGLWLLCRGWTVKGLHWSHSGSQGGKFCFEVCHHISSINCYFVYIVLWYTTSGILWAPLVMSLKIFRIYHNFMLCFCWGQLITTEKHLFLSQYDSSETPSKFVWKSRRLFNIVCLFLFFPKKFLVLVSYKFFFPY